MTHATQPQPSAAPAKTKRRYRTNRRPIIVSALRKCVLRNGYADTTITDIADEANISLSHLLYYYPGKDEILIDLVTEHHGRISQTMQIELAGDPVEMIDSMVDSIFIATTAEELDLLREFVGLAVHRPELNTILEKYAVAGYQQFERIFEATPRKADLSPSDSANLAGALWLGLMVQVDVRSTRDEAKTRRLFRAALLRIAGLDGAAPATSTYAGRIAPGEC